MRAWLGSVAASRPAGGGSPLAALHDSLSAEPTISQAIVQSAITSAGFRNIAVPTYNALAESMSGTTSSNPSPGQFDYTAWDSATVYPLAELPNTNLNSRPALFMIGVINNNYMGIAAWAYEDYSGPTALRSLWYPNQSRNQAWWYVDKGQPTSNASYLTGSDSTSTIFSDGQGPNTNGYNSTSRFSSDDGSWGFAIGTSRLDGNGGPYLSGNPNSAFGCENRNSGDSAAQEAFWHGQYNTTNYQFYVCIADQNLY